MSVSWELQKAVYGVLSVDATLGAIATGVFDDVAEGLGSFPFVTIGDQTAIEFDTDKVDGFEATITIHAWSQYPGQKEVMQVQSAIYDALHHATLTLTGFDALLCRQVDQAVMRDPDGYTRHGVQTYNVLIQKQ